MLPCIRFSLTTLNLTSNIFSSCWTDGTNAVEAGAEVHEAAGHTIDAVEAVTEVHGAAGPTNDAFLLREGRSW